MLLRGRGGGTGRGFTVEKRERGRMYRGAAIGGSGGAVHGLVGRLQDRGSNHGLQGGQLKAEPEERR